MRKIILILIGIFILVTPVFCSGALNPFTQSIDARRTVRGPYAWQGHPSRDLCWTWAKEIESRLDGGTSNALFYFTPGSAPTTAVKGMIYYDSGGNSLKYYTTGWQTLGTTSGVSLDDAYDLGNTIDVDGSAVTLDNDTTDNNVLLILTQDDTTGNTDAMTIVNTNTGDAIQISPGATTGGGINIIAKASGLSAILTVDGASNNWDGADNVGMVTITTDDPVVNTGASLLHVSQTGTPIAAAEGFLARFRMEGGSAVTDAYAVEIQTVATTPCLKLDGQMTIAGQGTTDGVLLDIISADTSTDTVQLTGVGTADVLQITPNATTAVALHIVGKASSSVTVVDIDGATADWIGGSDDVAMVEITGGSTANANAGGGLLAVISACTPAVASEGFLARFIHTGSARASSWAVEIETANTQGCLNLNNNVTISGANGSGTLLNIVHQGASGDADGIVMTHNGDGDAMQITLGETTSMGIHLIAAANQATSSMWIDGTTGDWIGANDVGMLHITGDTVATNVGSTLCFIQSVASPYAASEGFLLRLEQKTGAAVTDAYAMQIQTTSTTPCLSLNNELDITGIDSSAGVLLSITSTDGNDDTVQLKGVGTADVLQITPDATTAIGINVIAKVSGTTSDVIIDGTAGWVGASNVGLLHIKSDTELTGHVDASLLVCINTTGQPKASAMGYLARFVDSGTARVGAYAVEIDATATTGNLSLNGPMVINGQGATDGTLLAIVSADTDSDAVTLLGVGTADVLQITANATTATAINVVGIASTTASLFKMDGSAGAGWIGTTNVGMIHILNDGTAAQTTATMLYIAATGTNVSGQLGVCARFIDGTTSGGGTEYAVAISSANNKGLWVDTGGIVVDDFITATKGLQVGVGETMTTAGAEGAGQQIDDGVTFANVTTTTGVTEFITLPNDPPIGTVVYVMNNVGANFEIRTLAAGNDSINNIDTSDAATEYLCTSGGANNGDLVQFTYVTADRWIGVSYTYLGAVRTAVVPD